MTSTVPEDRAPDVIQEVELMAARCGPLGHRSCSGRCPWTPPRTERAFPQTCLVPTVQGDAPSSGMSWFTRAQPQSPGEFPSPLCGCPDTQRVIPFHCLGDASGSAERVCTCPALLLGAEGENVGLPWTMKGDDCHFGFLGTKHGGCVLDVSGTHRYQVGQLVALEVGDIL